MGKKYISAFRGKKEIDCGCPSEKEGGKKRRGSTRSPLYESEKKMSSRSQRKERAYRCTVKQGEEEKKRECLDHFEQKKGH